MNQISQTLPRLSPGRPDRLGAVFDGDGTNFALFSENAERVLLCLFSEDGKREIARLALPERSGPVWHGYVPGLKPGALYGYRVEGRYAPEAGARFNPNKLLLDPYARQWHGKVKLDGPVFGYEPDGTRGDLGFCTLDSAPSVPKCVVTDPAEFARYSGQKPQRDESGLIYEAHVRGATMLRPDIGQDMRGTFDAIAAPPVLDHLTRIGVSAVELLPVQAFLSEGFLVRNGLRNYWGYNTLGFFVPEPSYQSARGIASFRAMVARFHEAGIRVLLDVVYNHSAEGNELGPTLSFRGIDNAAYYRLTDGSPRYYVNDTGTGNTLNVSHPFVMRMVLDSLRFWVEVMGVDGFRFDLATTLCREDQGFDPAGGFLDALRQDPVLAGVELIAEPWDVGPGGYQLGNFPPPFKEWNDRYRDDARRFWRGDSRSAHDLANGLLGSSEPFEGGGRLASSSVNFVASHDGFTLADTTAYLERHNHANGEDNRDGHDSNFSDNLGVEGKTEDKVILAARARRVRNMLATLFLSQGTPMLLAGDELGHSQGGNNNAYNQDNPTSWIDWPGANAERIDFVAALSAFRKANPVLRQRSFMHGQARAQDGLPDVEWLSFHGKVPEWENPALGRFCLLLRSSAEAQPPEAEPPFVLIAFNRSTEAQMLALPPLSSGVWVRHIDTDTPTQQKTQVTGPLIRVAGASVAVFASAERT